MLASVLQEMKKIGFGRPVQLRELRCAIRLDLLGIDKVIDFVPRSGAALRIGRLRGIPVHLGSL